MDRVASLAQQRRIDENRQVLMRIASIMNAHNITVADIQEFRNNQKKTPELTSNDYVTLANRRLAERPTHPAVKPHGQQTKTTKDAWTK